MSYIQGLDRNQPMFSNFFILDELIKETAPVRAIDAFIDSLNLKELGFKVFNSSARGQQPYNCKDLLKIHLYCFFNKITSSRKQEL